MVTPQASKAAVRLRTAAEDDNMSTHNICFPHLNIWVKAGLSHTLPVRSSLKTHFIHTRCKHLFCNESWATSIIISDPVETKYDCRPMNKDIRCPVVMCEIILCDYVCCILHMAVVLRILPSGYQTPGISGGVMSIEIEGHAGARDTHRSVQHMGGQRTR